MRGRASFADLARDHGAFAALARRIGEAVEGNAGTASPADAAREALRFWHTEGLFHVREEAEIVLPACMPGALSPRDLAVRAAALDPAWFKGAFQDLAVRMAEGTDWLPLLEEIGRRLHAHAALWDGSLLPHVSAALPAPALEALSKKAAAFRRRFRGASAAGAPADPGARTAR